MRQRARRLLAAALVAAATLLGSAGVRAERLALTHFTSEHGLPDDEVHCATIDRRGFVWLGTTGGLARFDGNGFRSFGRELGLAEPRVRSIVEDGDDLVVGTAAGSIYRFEAAGGGRFRRILAPPEGPPIPAVLHRDRRGRIWVGRDGLRLLDRSAGSSEFRRVTVAPEAVVFDFAEDPAGNLWLGSDGLHVLAASGRRHSVGLPPGFRWIRSVAVDEDGRVWASASEGLCVVESFRPESDVGISACRRVPGRDPPDLRGAELVPRRRGGVWAGNGAALLELDPSGRILRRIGTEQGLATAGAWPLLLDDRGDPWFAVESVGVARLALDGLTSFGAGDGLVEPRIGSIFRTLGGDWLAAGTGHVLQRHENGRFAAVRPAVPPTIVSPGWGWHQFELQDALGDWWIPTGNGIVRFAAVSRLEDLAGARPKAVYTVAHGLPSDDVFRLFEDGQGDVWIAVLYPHPAVGRGEGPTLCRWTRATGRFASFGSAHGIPETSAPTAFLELPDGSIWIGFEDGIFRFRHGRFEGLHGLASLRGVLVSAFFRDARGAVWIGTRGLGACRVDEPSGPAPTCAPLRSEDGLASDHVNGFAEDVYGRIYVGTSEGVDIVEARRVIRHLDRAHGLPHRYVNVVAGDPRGPIWFGTLNGLARLDPRSAHPASRPPAVRIDGIRIGGTPRPLSAYGESSVYGVELGPSPTRLQIDLVGIVDEPGKRVAFRHRLGPDEPWSPPTAERTVLLPSLRPGRYRFEVRLEDAAWDPSEPAGVSIRVLAPLWARPWFLGIAALLLAGAAVAGYRLRVAHLLALQRERTRIAMDLHDEMGSGLGSIGVLADLATSPGLEEPRRLDLLEQIASTASELGGSMGDIVWSLRSGADSLEALASHLVERGRRLFPDEGPAFRTRFPEAWPSVRLTLATRYHLAMIALEAMHNARRHARASEVVLSVEPDGGMWTLSVTDDGVGLGRGVDPAGGAGLANMRRRAEEIGAALRVESGGGGAGTSVSVNFDPETPRARRPI